MSSERELNLADKQNALGKKLYLEMSAAVKSNKTYNILKNGKEDKEIYRYYAHENPNIDGKYVVKVTLLLHRTPFCVDLFTLSLDVKDDTLTIRGYGENEKKHLIFNPRALEQVMKTYNAAVNKIKEKVAEYRPDF